MCLSQLNLGSVSFLTVFLKRVVNIFGSLFLTLELIVFTPTLAISQDLEPRLYSNLPIDLNFIVAGYGYTEGGVVTDPSIPLENANIKIDASVLAYARTLEIFGNSSKVDLILPSACLSGTADVAGEPRARNICGISDPRLRLATNFFGAPALSLKEFTGAHQNTILGASLQLGVPLGQYDSDKLVNLGTNRWLIKPELGGSKKLGPIILELSAATSFFTDNDNFNSGKNKQQKPIYSLQAHLIYPHQSGVWAALDGTYYWGGETTVDGIEEDDWQENQRLGLTLGLPISRNYSIKFYGSTGLYTRSGSDFDILGFTFQYRWGSGL